LQAVGGCRHLQGLTKAAGYLDRPSTTLLEQTTTDASMCVSRYQFLQGRAHSFRHSFFSFSFFFPFLFLLPSFLFPPFAELASLDHSSSCLHFILFFYLSIPLCPLHLDSCLLYLAHCASTLSCLSSSSISSSPSSLLLLPYTCT